MIIIGIAIIFALWAICKVASDADDAIEREEYERDKTEK